MKKVLILGLITIALAFVESMQLQVAPVDYDVGYAYVINADVIQPDMYMTDNSSPLYSPCYTIQAPADVGISASICEIPRINQEILWQNQLSTSFETNAKSIKTEGLSRLDTGERQSQDRVLSRHT